ncbi:MAG: hypothetical protein F4137_24000 [Acidobacteria bacterium]|nr:hypothetical protein [Acidobacteriota bacterium]
MKSRYVGRPAVVRRCRLGVGLLVLLVACVVGGTATVQLSGQHEVSRQGGDLLRAFVPEVEHGVLELGDMSEEQQTALATLLAGYYFAGLSDAVQDGTISGSFEGWDGDTIVELTDGSVFKQTEYHYEYDYSYRPDVTIFVEPFGYELLVEDTDEPVEVELLRSSRYAGGSLGRHERFRALLARLPQQATLRALSIWSAR